MQAALLIDDADWAEAAQLLVQLRPQYTHESLLAQMHKQHPAGYRLMGVRREDGSLVGVAGFVISDKLAWGRHMYVDDLVTDSAQRASGVGSVLITALKAHARTEGCEQLRLDSGVQRFDAHRFYLKHGFHIASHHFAITDLN